MGADARNKNLLFSTELSAACTLHARNRGRRKQRPETSEPLHKQESVIEKAAAQASKRRTGKENTKTL